MEKDLVSQLMSFEDGLLSEEEIDELFQTLYDTDIIFHLQGCYGRTMADLIRQGRIKI